MTACLTVLGAACFSAPFTVNRIFANNMVLQREKEIPVWGTAAPGTEITVSFKGTKQTVKTGEDGKWLAKLPAQKAESKPQNLIVRSGKNMKAFSNVLVGEVWMFFGQSHIELSYGGKLRELNGADKRVMASETRTNLIDTIKGFVSNVPADPQLRCGRIWLTGKVYWYPCGKQFIKNFGVVSYNMGKALRKELNVPVAILNISRGCSSIESWIPAEYYDHPVLAEEKQYLDEFVKFYNDKTAKKLTQEQEDEYFTKYCNTPKRKMRGNLKGGKVRPGARSWVWQHMRAVMPTGCVLSAARYANPFPVRGMIWWQGGTNYYDPDGHYLQKFPILMEAYRKNWNDPDMNFVMVLQGQSKNYKGIYSKFRLQQFAAAETLDKLLLVNNVMTPPAEAKMVHPYGEKVQVGKETAKLVLKHFYGRAETMGSGPLFDTAVFKDGKATVTFRFGKGLKTSDGKAPVGFELAGKDKVYHPAQAEISGEGVVLSSAKVPAPEYARFMWEDVDNVSNLVNAEDLTAFPFDTQYEFFQKKNKINAK